MKNIERFNNHQKNSHINENLNMEEVKKDLSRKFRDLDLGYLNGLSHEKLLTTSIYSYLHEIELISRKYDGALAGHLNVDDKYLEDFLEETKGYIKKINEFFNGLR